MPQLCPRNFEYPRQLKELPHVYGAKHPTNEPSLAKATARTRLIPQPAPVIKTFLDQTSWVFTAKQGWPILQEEAKALVMRASSKSGYWRGSYELVVEIDFSVIAARWHESLHKLRGHLHNDYNRYPMAI